MLLRLVRVIFFSLGLFASPDNVSANPQIVVQCDAPYFLVQSRDSVSPGSEMRVRIVVENRGRDARRIPLELFFSLEFLPLSNYENWQVERRENGHVLKTEVALNGGYGQWLDLLSVRVAPEAPMGLVPVRLKIAEDERRYDVKIAPAATERTTGGVFATQVSMPLDKDGKRDDRLHENTIVLRDRQWDYIRNLLRGKGASNLAAESVHPIAHMGVELLNPATEQKAVVLISRLLDYQTRQPVEGLITPDANGEDPLAGGEMTIAEGSRSFVVLSGEKKQRVLLPLYTDEKISASGRYWLQTVLSDESGETLLAETPITLIQKNHDAAIAVVFSSVAVLGAMLFGFSRLRRSLQSMQTRWLITIALFGTTTFACVNVPSTLLGDFFHVLLGPFGFLITGLFSGVFQYMLLIALFTLIPRSGVITLIMMIRMLLGMLAFGHITLPGILSYGLQSLGLELAVYRYSHNPKAQQRFLQGKSIDRESICLALACALADCVTTYINLQASVVLYRLYYATWYILLVMAFNGFFYTVIGVFCGTALGRQLLKIKG